MAKHRHAAPRGRLRQRIEHLRHERVDPHRLPRELRFRAFQLALLRLQRPHLRIHAAAFEQFVVGAVLDEPAVLHHEDAIGVDDGRQPVRDDEARAMLRDAHQFLLDRALRARVERRRRLVEHDDRRRLQQRARDRDPLPLAARQPYAALADARVVCIGQPLDERVELRAARRRDHLAAGRVALAVRDVVRERVVEQDGVLRDDAERVAQAALGDEPQVLTVDPDRARIGLVQPEQQPRERRLARPAAADHRDRLPGLDAERHVEQDLPARLVAEVDVLELDRAAAHDERLRAGRIAVLARPAARIEQPEQPLDVRHRVVRLAEHETERVQRQADLDDVRVDQHEIADRHRAARDLLPGEQHHGRDPRADACALPDMQRRQRVLVVHAGLAPFVEHAVEPVALDVLACEILDRVDVQQAVDHARIRLGLERVHAPLVTHAPARKHHRIRGVDGERDENDRREAAAVLADHDDQHRADLDGRRHDRKHRDAEQVADPGRAFLEVAHHGARLALRMKACAEPMQVAERAHGKRRDRMLRDLHEGHVAHFVQRVGCEAYDRVREQQ
ncbi:hypothetical protein P355_2306 [Burkholderia cenocepacia KC-01]|nr:hypothetical protein P355_2306 [Burkholderia cenocepacia KC-01]